MISDKQTHVILSYYNWEKGAETLLKNTMRAVGKTRLVAIAIFGLSKLKAIGLSPILGDYKAWRCKFFRERLCLASQIAFLWSLSLFLVSLLDPEYRRKLWLILGTAELFSIGICLALQKTRFGRSQPHLLFILLGWSMTVYTQIGLSWGSYADFNFSIWTFTFLILAVLIPVYWYLHFVVQLGVFAFYFATNAVLDAVPKSSFIEHIELAIALLWVCFICNLAVFLYEKLRQSELSVRQDLESLIYTVSAELRTPVVHNLQVFQQLWQQSGEKIAVSAPPRHCVIARSTLKTIYQSSDRQLNLINSLLEKAKNNLTKQNNFSKPLDLIKNVLGYLNCRLNPFVTSKLTLNSVTASNPGGTEYQVWRYHFLRDRLHLVWWIAFGCTITLFAINFYEATLDPKEQPELFTYAAVILSLLAWLIFSKTKAGYSLPNLPFLSFVTCITIVPQLGDALNNDKAPIVGIWTLVFLLLATLIPVRWRLHITSQLMTFCGFLLISTIFGFNSEWLKPSQVLGTIWYLSWICFVCDLGVYTFENLQRAEFESRRQLRVFLHSVAHDLKTPVLGLSMVLENLLNKPEKEFLITRSMLERMIRGSDRQMHLLDSLLEVHNYQIQGVSTGNSRIAPTHCQPLQLEQLIQAIITDMQPLLVKNQASIYTVITDNLPSVNGDWVQLWRVFENLINNALKYNPPGVSITLEATVKASEIYCTVRDNGVGISPELCTRIFHLYSRGDGVRRSPGLGLGLYLCQQIITAHGGQIGVSSKVGIGSTFWFTLPRWDKNL